ncbi:hypothetical protein CsatA_005358 [Cannabis sativa]
MEAEDNNINTTNLSYAKVMGSIWLFLSGINNRLQPKINHTLESTPEQHQTVVNDDNPYQVTIELGFPSSIQSSTSPPSPSPPPPSPETEPATTSSSSSRSLLGSSSNYIPYFPFSNKLNNFDGESSVVSVNSQMSQPSTSTSSPSSSSRSIFSGTTSRKNSNHHSYTMAKNSDGNTKKEEEEAARATFLNQELPKFMLGIAATLLIGLMMLHFSHPEIYDMKKTKYLCLFIVIAFAALWIAVVLGGLPLLYSLLIIRNIGHSLILGAFYGIIAIFLWDDPNLFIVPVVIFVVSVALDTFKFVKDFNDSSP